MGRNESTIASKRKQGGARGRLPVPSDSAVWRLVALVTCFI